MQPTDPAPGEALNELERPHLSYMPALDGLRGVALGMVFLFHSNYEFARGGHLGVTVFFVLSGFLITSLLLIERDTHGAISAVRFWGRRARRLVPAALVTTLLIAVLATFRVFGPVPGLPGDGASALGWVANWRFILADKSYAEMFAVPSPFRHFWSLAVEEQMYLLLPLVLIAFTRKRIRRGVLGAILATAIAGSTLASTLLHEGSVDRAYYGTDARIAEPLVGALLAVILLGQGRVRQLGRGMRGTLDGMSIGAFIGIAYLSIELSVRNPRLYEGGFLITSVLAAVIVASASQPSSLVSRMLSAPPLVGVGRISYGAYLFHWPVFLWLTESSTRLTGVQLLTVRMVATLSLAGVSYWFIESPVRYARNFSPRLAMVGWANGLTGALASLVFAATSIPAGNAIGASPAGQVPHPPPVPQTAPAKQTPGKVVGQQVASAAQDWSGLPAGEGSGLPETPGPDTGPGPAPVIGSGYLRVAVLGDSLSNNLATGLKVWGESEEVTVYDLSIPACPISREGHRRLDNGEPFPIPEGCNWWEDPSSDHSRALTEFHPDVIVIQDGTNELPDRKLDSWATYRRPGEPAFDQWLRSEYSALHSQFIKSGVDVLMLNAVCADWPRFEGWRSYRARVDSLNATVYPTIQTEGGRLGDLNRRVCPAGRFSNSVEGVDNARPDGLHFTDEASVEIARNWLGPLVLEGKKRVVGQKHLSR